MSVECVLLHTDRDASECGFATALLTIGTRIS